MNAQTISVVLVVVSVLLLVINAWISYDVYGVPILSSRKVDGAMSLSSKTYLAVVLAALAVAGSGYLMYLDKKKSS